MSLYYDIHEHLILRAFTDESRPVVRAMTQQLAQLGAMLLRGTCTKCSLSLTADGNTFGFVRTSAMPGDLNTLQELLNVFQNAQQLELITDFGFDYDGTYEPNFMTGILLRYGENLPQEVFYSMYNYSDYDSGNVGNLVAYGTKDGKHYHGSVPYKVVNDLPQQGLWWTPETAVRLESEDWADFDYAQCKAICEKLSTLSSADTLQVDDNSFLYTMNNLNLDSPEKLSQYVALCAQLMEASYEQCKVFDEYVDLDSADHRLMRLDILPSGSCTAEVSDL